MIAAQSNMIPMIFPCSIYASSFFTALNDGFISALISFARTLVFQVAAVTVLPVSISRCV